MMRSPIFSMRVNVTVVDDMSNSADVHTVELKFSRLTTIQELEKAIAGVVKAAAALPRGINGWEGKTN
jgi:hypothetical protein